MNEQVRTGIKSLFVRFPLLIGSDPSYSLGRVRIEAHGGGLYVLTFTYNHRSKSVRYERKVSDCLPEQHLERVVHVDYLDTVRPNELAKFYGHSGGRRVFGHLHYLA